MHRVRAIAASLAHLARTAEPKGPSYAGLSTPNGIRTRAAGVKGRCPRPLDDGGLRRRVPPASPESSLVEIRARTLGGPRRDADLLELAEPRCVGLGSARSITSGPSGSCPSFVARARTTSWRRATVARLVGYASISPPCELTLVAARGRPGRRAVTGMIPKRSRKRARRTGRALAVTVSSGDSTLASLVGPASPFRLDS